MNGCLPSPFRLTEEARRQPGFFKDTSKFREKLEEVLPSVAKHELSYLNGFGVFNNLAWCARRKARFEGEFEATVEQACYLGLSFAFNYCADQIAKARHDYFRQVLEHGIAIANSQCACYEATSTTMYSDFYSSALENAQSEFRKFLLSETAKQRAKADVHGASQSGSSK